MRKEGDTTIIEDSDLEPVTKEEFRAVIDPMMDCILSLAKATMELSAAGKRFEDSDFSRASSRAFYEVGRTIRAMRHVQDILSTFDMKAPEQDLRDE
ncbi:hypothetical protein [Pseudomonas aeruginosa]|uniref:hypothetical protein n=1 Tax=Pseudomonas aeruginosa TaxID=287 RepID=UPI0021F1C1F7|nr:hypothetical protein [Pseudomonas aeruginosa]MCV6247412.1 hypothetical protein [Pseudomonas aeruginosa]